MSTIGTFGQIRTDERFSYEGKEGLKSDSLIKPRYPISQRVESKRICPTHDGIKAKENFHTEQVLSSGVRQNILPDFHNLVTSVSASSRMLRAYMVPWKRQLLKNEWSDSLRTGENREKHAICPLSIPIGSSFCVQWIN